MVPQATPPPQLHVRHPSATRFPSAQLHLRLQAAVDVLHAPRHAAALAQPGASALGGSPHLVPLPQGKSVSTV